MPRALWPLLNDQPSIRVDLTTSGGQSAGRILLADTGAGTANADFELLLDERDCTSCGGIELSKPIILGGAYTGPFRLYLIRVRIPAIAFDRHVFAVGVTQLPAGFDGIAGFPFLNRFTYGNFGDRNGFGLEL
jgi:hypothetical protein